MGAWQLLSKTQTFDMSCSIYSALLERLTYSLLMVEAVLSTAILLVSTRLYVNFFKRLFLLK